MALTAKGWGDRGRRRALALGIDPARLPPGQSPTEKFPVLSVGPTPDVDLATWRLEVAGLVLKPLSLGWDDLLALGQTEQVVDLHCVTRWSKFDTRWTGVRVRDLLALAAPRPEAAHVMVHGYDGYTTNVPLDLLRADDVMIAHHFDGRPLEPDHGGPARLLLPSRYLWKSAKWVKALVLMREDAPGFWERNGYHNEGDFWHEQRTNVDPLAFRALRRSAREEGF